MVNSLRHKVCLNQAENWCNKMVKLILRNLLKKEDGAAIVIISIAMVAILGFMSLVTDFGLLALNKERLQNACDAAALAGSRELPDQANAILVASDYLQNNDVSPTEAEISFPQVNGAPTIQVSVKHSVEFFFAKVLGINSGTVSGSAQAVCGGISSATGIVPFSIPDQNLQFGVEYTLKYGGGDGDNGNFGALALGGNGANNYRSNIKNGYNGRISVGDWVTTEPGNMSGPTSDGVNYRMSQCTHQCTPNDYQLDCPRVITIPIYDPNMLGHGRSEVKIVGFALFLLTGVDGNGNKNVVHGYFLNSVPPNSSNVSTDPGQNTYGVVITKLIK